MSEERALTGNAVRLVIEHRIGWRCIPGLSHYDVSEYGDVRRNVRARTRRAGHLVMGHIGKIRGQGYRTCKLANGDGTKSIYRAHRLVAEAFIGPAPSPEHQIAHYDGNPLNNHVSNLRWATASENSLDRNRHGTNTFLGERNPKAKLTPNIVRRIRTEYRPGYGNKTKLRRQYGLSRNAFDFLLDRKNWRHVD